VDDNCFLFESKLYDSNGEFILDIKDKIKTSLGVEIFNPAVVDELPGWVRIGTIDNRVNLINSKGELYFNQWLSLSLFNWDGAQFLSDGSLMFRQLGFGLHYYSKNGEDLRNKENIEELGIWNKDWVVERRKNHPIVVRNLLDKKTFEFGGFDGILHGGFNNQNNVAIVIDENKIFYGLFINDKLVYPCEYNNITYDKKEDTFTLTKGSSTTVIRVARNGRVIPR